MKEGGPAVDFEAMMAAYANAGFEKPAHEPPTSYQVTNIKNIWIFS